MNGSEHQGGSQTTDGARRLPFGLISACALVVANMIGAGVFTTSGFSLLDLTRPVVMVAWVIAGLIALCGAYSYGLLAARIGESGGEYLFLSRTIHPGVGFIAGWVSLLAGFTGAIAFAAVTFETYAFPESLRPTWYLSGMLPVAAILLFAILHSWVLRMGVVAQNLVVLVKLILIAAFLLYAFAFLPVGGWRGLVSVEVEKPFSILAFATSLVYISLSYSGFNAAVYISEEIRDSKRNVPRAMLLATLVVMALYLLFNFIFIYGPETSKITGQPDIAAVAADAIGGPIMQAIVRTIICLALLSSVSSMIIAGPRVYAKMAEDGVFPRWFNFVDVGQERVPKASIWFQALLASLVVVASTLQQLLSYLAFTLSISAALTVACVYFPGRDSHKLRFSTLLLLPSIYICVTLCLAAMLVINEFKTSGSLLECRTLIGFVATIASGLILYAISKLWGNAKTRAN
ncbi:MAG TPA: APC family permease [Pirellulaceae bacterium]|nr:APC family permease [Pirellulaceae bacterium]HMO93623.1 APC family permease [Pirellulaceae bacterium]HMP70495.1 APC family permease [Pirellulaceae bacterium]